MVARVEQFLQPGPMDSETRSMQSAFNVAGISPDLRDHQAIALHLLGNPAAMQILTGSREDLSSHQPQMYRRTPLGPPQARNTPEPDTSRVAIAEYDNILTRTPFRFHDHRVSMVDTAVTLYRRSATPVGRQTLIEETPAMRAAATAGLWIRSNSHMWLGVAEDIVDWPLCPFDLETIFAYTTATDWLPQAEEANFMMTITGIPKKAVGADVLRKLRAIGLEVIEDSLFLSSTTVKFKRHPHLPTIYALILVKNTPTAWAAASGGTFYHWQDDNNPLTASLLGFRVETTTHSLRMVTRISAQIQIMSLLFAIGFQEEEAARLIITILRNAGYAAMWVRFDDTALNSRGSNGISKPCQWHSINSGITVIFSSEYTMEAALQQQSSRAPPVLNLMSILNTVMGTTTEFKALLAKHIEGWDNNMLNTISLSLRLQATSSNRTPALTLPTAGAPHAPPRLRIFEQIGENISEHTVVIQLTPDLRQAILARVGRTLHDIKAWILRSAGTHKIPIVEVLIVRDDLCDWQSDEGVALVLDNSESKGAELAQELAAALHQDGGWDPIAELQGTDIATPTDYRALLASDNHSGFTMVRGRYSNRGSQRGRGQPPRQPPSAPTGRGRGSHSNTHREPPTQSDSLRSLAMVQRTPPPVGRRLEDIVMTLAENVRILVERMDARNASEATSNQRGSSQ
jgi:hypothetical protein